MTTTNYQQQAIDFLNQTSTAFTAKFTKHAPFFSDDKESRDIYRYTLKNKLHTYRFNFGQSINNSNNNTPPTAYDVLACLTKYEVGMFDDFCADYGYDTDSRTAYKTYKAVLKEWKNVELRFTAEQLELLQEIN